MITILSSIFELIKSVGELLINFLKTIYNFFPTFVTYFKVLSDSFGYANRVLFLSGSALPTAIIFVGTFCIMCSVIRIVLDIVF